MSVRDARRAWVRHLDKCASRRSPEGCAKDADGKATQACAKGYPLVAAFGHAIRIRGPV